MVSVDVPEFVMLVVDNESASPGGDVLLVSVTMPVNPNNALTVIVEEQEAPPAIRNMEVGFAESSKSGPLTDTNKSAVAVKPLVLFPETEMK